MFSNKLMSPENHAPPLSAKTYRTKATTVFGLYGGKFFGSQTQA